MSTMKLYAHPQSPPSRTVTLALDVLKVEHEYKFVDLFAGEARKPEYLKMNPQHNVPFLVDGDFSLGESIAIVIYLGERYGDRAPGFYPKDDLKLRAKINQRICFNIEVFWDALFKCFGPIAFRGQKEVDKSAVTRLEEVLGWVRDFLSPSGFVAGTPGPTLADYAFLSIYTTLQATDGYFVDLSRWPEIADWAAKIRTTVNNYDKANGDGAEVFRNFWQKRKPQ